MNRLFKVAHNVCIVGRLWLLVLVASVAVMFAETAQAQTIIRVDGINGVATPTGLSPGGTWANSFKHLQDALTHVSTTLSPPPSQQNPVQLWVRGSNGGGAYNFKSSSPIYVNCTFTENFAGHAGGAVTSQGDLPGEPIGSPSYINCAFIDNTAVDFGGGMRAGYEPNATLTNCTFVANATTGTTIGHGGGFSAGRMNPTSVVGQITIGNCIFWANTATGSGTQIALHGPNPAQVTLSYCDVQDSDQTSPGVFESGVYVGNGMLNWSTATNFDANPLFVNLANRDLRFTSLSPCINKANCSVLSLLDQFDVDGDNNATEGALDLGLLARFDDRLDIGVHEYSFSNICPGDANADGTIDVDDLLITVNNWNTIGPLGDIAPFACGNNLVDVDDFLLDINNWGAACNGNVAGESMPQPVDDCMDRCDNRCPGGGTPWADCVDTCVEALCRIGTIDCD